MSASEDNLRCVDDSSHAALAMGGNGAVDPDRGSGGDVQGEDLAVDTRAGSGDWTAEKCIRVGWRAWRCERRLRDGVLGAVEVELDGISYVRREIVGRETQVSTCV